MSQIKLKHSGGNSVIIAAPDSNPASDVTLKLPNQDGSANEFLKTDGSGTLSFAAAGGGKVRQFKHQNFSSTYSTTSSSYQHVSGLDLAFTPTASDSILVYDLLLHVRNQESSGTAPNSFTAISIDGGSNYLYAFNNYQIFAGISNYLVILPLRLRFATVAGNTSARTYEVYVRLNGYAGTGDTLTLMQNSGEIQMASVTEYEP